MNKGILSSGTEALHFKDQNQTLPLKDSKPVDNITELGARVKEPALTRLDTLPPEVIKYIFSCFTKDADYLNETIWNDHWAFHDTEALLSLALVNKKIGPWAQEVLIASPIINCVRVDWGCSHMEFLVRALLESHHMRPKIQRLTIMLSKRTHGRYYGLAAGGVFQHLLMVRIKRYIMSLALPRKFRKSWINKMRIGYPYTLLGVVLLLAPNIKEINVILDGGETKGCSAGFLCMIFGVALSHSERLAHIQNAGHLSCLESLTCSGRFSTVWSGIEHFSQIRKLHLNSKFYPGRTIHRGPALVADGKLGNITHLILNMIIMPMRYCILRSDPCSYYGPLLARFSNLEHLEIVGWNREHGLYEDDMLMSLVNPSKLLTLKLYKSANYPDKSANYPATAMGKLINLQRLSTSSLGVENLDPNAPHAFEVLPGSLRYLYIEKATLNTVHCVMRLLQEKLDRENWQNITEIGLEFVQSFSSRSIDLLRDGVMFPSLLKNSASSKVCLRFKEYDGE